MATENFTPIVWAAEAQVRLRKNLIFGAVASREYEGLIRGPGDQVKINEIGPITVGTYTKGTDMTWATLDDASKYLLIDQYKYVNYMYDDIDRVQNMNGVDAAAQSEAMYAMADTIDQFLASHYTGAGLSVDAATVTVGNVLSNVAAFKLAMDEGNVPTNDRYLIVPPWYHLDLLNAVAAGGLSATGTLKVLDNGLLVRGFVGELYGFTILISNNVYASSTTVFQPIACTRRALAYAGQFTTVERVRDFDQFGTGFKALYVYGAKVVRPEEMCTCTVTNG